MHVGDGGSLELHGKEKLHWTTLEDHIFRNNVPVEELRFLQTSGISTNGKGIGNRLGKRIIRKIVF